MATIKEVMEKGFRQWFEEGMNHTITVIKMNWLTGPRPQRLGVVRGNLRNRIVGKTSPDGYAVGTRVGYGVYWEKGIKGHRVTVKNAKALMIPLASQRPGTGRWTKTLKRSTGLTKLKGGGKLRRNLGNLVIFRKSVYIPKQEPRKFLEPGTKQALPDVLRIGNRVMGNEFLDGLFKSRTVGK